MGHKALVPLILVLFLGLSLFLSSDAVPTSRTLRSFQEHQLVQDLHVQGHEMVEGEGSDVEQAVLERRMDIEITDYPGTGANNNHEPRSPGRV